MEPNFTICTFCSKHIYPFRDIYVCQSCQEYSNSLNILNIQSSSQKQYSCPQCTFKNPIDSVQCIVCQFIFQQKLDYHIPTKVVKQQSAVTCKKCGLQNHISNQYCLSCQQQLFQHLTKLCQFCHLKIKENIFEKHYEACLLSKVAIQQQDKHIGYKEDIIFPIDKPMKVDIFKKPKQESIIKPIKPQRPSLIQYGKGLFGAIRKQPTAPSCYYCYKKIPKAQFNQHSKNCQKRISWQRNMEPALSRMTPLQAKAIHYMHEKSSKQHQSVRSALENRIHKLGYSADDLQNLQFYIQNYAPIIIQIHVSKHMEFFVKDTHYRSQFQTNKSSGSLSRSSRTQWQDRMFDKYYSKATDFQRVKYGVINFTNDPKGVQCAACYGPSYFLLKSHVRDRCTFTDKDSSSSDASIATLKFSFQIISKMNDNQLKAAFHASKALQHSSNVLVTYKQLQIHGPIQFSKDIQRIYVNKKQINGNKKFLDLVYEFSQKFKVEHDFI